MKSDFHDIGDLLRARKPEPPAVPPGLEARILRAVEQRARPRPERHPRWLWFVLPPAFAAAALWFMSFPREPAKPAVSRVAAPEILPDPLGSFVDSANPLFAETSALTRDAERAGGFLINCLPSLGSRDE